MLDRVLEFITTAAWLLLGAAAVFYFVKGIREQGLKFAFLKLFSSRVLIPLLLALILTVLNASLIFIQPQNIGVVVSLVSRVGYRDQPLRSGLHWIVPLAEEVIQYPIYWQTYTMSGKPVEGDKVGDDSIVARTKDGQEVGIDCSVIFRIDSEQVIWVHIDWQERYIQDFVRPVVRGGVRDHVAIYTVDEVNSDKRTDLKEALDRYLRGSFENKGLILDQFVLRNISFSPEYAASVERKQVALQEQTLKEYQAEQIRKLAAGEADRVRRLAEGEADRVTTLAGAQATAVVVKAEAEAKALQLVSEPLAQNRDLLNYQYISRLSPQINVMLVPSDAPFILPFPTPFPGSMLPTPTPTATGGITSSGALTATGIVTATP